MNEHQCLARAVAAGFEEVDALLAGAETARSDGARALAHEHALHSCRLLEVILEHRGPQAAAPQAAGA